MTREQHQQIIDQLEGLNEKVARQNSWAHIFTAGLIYGVGFVIGSTILASILLGTILPILRQTPYMRAIIDHPAPQLQATSTGR